MNFQAEVNKILKNRQDNLPKLEREMKKVQSLQDKGKVVLNLFEELKNNPQLPPNLDLNKAMTVIDNGIKDLKGQQKRLEHLKNRFERKTINIGVSGQARVGKSTWLQSVSGLQEDQIPTGTGLPVTAVRSRIFNQLNDKAPFALIKFYDEDTFLEKYVNSHLELFKKTDWHIHSLSEFASFSFPDTVDSLNLPNPTAASNSLKKLQEAQGALDAFRPLLRGNTITLNNLQELRPYTAYPTNDEINAGNPEALKRLYLAVEDIQIFCSFPRLSGSGFGLVDLPGLGEVSESVKKMHLDGLENEVDHVIMVLRPEGQTSFVGNMLVNNIDALSSIQPGISERGNFVSILINRDENAEKQGLVKILQDDINRAINDKVPNSKYEVRTINALIAEEAGAMLGQVLERLTAKLPIMDQEVLDAYMVKQKAIETGFVSELGIIGSEIEGVSRQYPSDMGAMLEAAETLQENLADNFKETLAQLRNTLDENVNSEEKDRFFNQVEEIYLANTKAIEEGLWKAAEWESRGKKTIAARKGPSGFFEEECNRIRVEIAQSFEGPMNRVVFLNY